MRAESGTLQDYLAATEIIDHEHPSITEKTRDIIGTRRDTVEIARIMGLSWDGKRLER